jgi:hypothetical protein
MDNMTNPSSSADEQMYFSEKENKEQNLVSKKRPVPLNDESKFKAYFPMLD